MTSEPTIERIVGDLEGSGAAWFSAFGSFGWRAEQVQQVRRALGILEDHRDLADHWSRDAVIEVSPDQLHPWVWDAARGLWESEHWGEAVEAAVKVVNSNTQRKVGRPDLSGTDLIRTALSAERPVLRVREDDGSETYQSAQEGAMHLGEAVFMYWRNVLGHEPGGSDRQPAVEGLAAVSTLARLIDAAEVATLTPDTNAEGS